jgi:two-component sensor histidine kinase
MWNKRKNGEIYPQQYTITAVKNREGLVTHYVNTLVDITEAKQRERERIVQEVELRDTLVREVHHRIKNNLQGVAGLLRNTAALHPSLQAPLTSAISQVHSIALIHGLQGRNALSSVQLCDLITEIASSQQTLWQKTITVSMPSDMQYYRIVETETVPLALVLNELIANAIKHGKQDTDIKIGVSVLPSHIEVRVTNNGKIASKNDGSCSPIAGTGLKLVDSLLPKKGAKLSWKQQGEYVITMLEITAPVITLTQ